VRDAIGLRIGYRQPVAALLARFASAWAPDVRAFEAQRAPVLMYE
jgi:hypothetical protein